MKTKIGYMIKGEPDKVFLDKKILFDYINKDNELKRKWFTINYTYNEEEFCDSFKQNCFINALSKMVLPKGPYEILLNHTGNDHLFITKVEVIDKCNASEA